MFDDDLNQLLRKGSVVEAQDGEVVFDLLGLIEGLSFVDEKATGLGWVNFSIVFFPQYLQVLFRINLVEELDVLAYGHSA